jgi:hypothetical protein
MKPTAAIMIVAGSAAAAAIAPVWTYSISLLLFGLPHVLVELRYVDERFAARIPRKLVLGLGAVLVTIAMVRAFALAPIGSSSERTLLELLLGTCLIVIAWPLLRQPRTSWLAILIGTALLLGVLYAPVATLVTMALLHNLTPVGFLAERLRGHARRRAMWLALLVFGLIPALLLFYSPSFLSLSEHAIVGPLSVGHLDNHLPAFVPPALLGTSFADRLFATAAYLQCMHYAVVLHVLPRLSGGDRSQHAQLPWPAPRVFGLAVAAAGLLMAIGFAANFVTARSVYSIFAAVHAWIEIPILLIATAALPSPANTEAIAA